MAKITDTPAPIAAVPDTRADSTLDTLGEIAAEEVAEAAADVASEAQDAARAAEQQAIDLTKEWREALDMAREMIVATVPPLDPVWSPDRLDRLAAALARCDEKYGWGGTGALLGSPLFGLAVAATPIAIGTYQVIKPMADAAKAARLEQEAKRAAIVRGAKLPVVQGGVAFGEQAAA